MNLKHCLLQSHLQESKLLLKWKKRLLQSHHLQGDFGHSNLILRNEKKIKTFLKARWAIGRLWHLLTLSMLSSIILWEPIWQNQKNRWLSKQLSRCFKLTSLEKSMRFLLIWKSTTPRNLICSKVTVIGRNNSLF